MRPQRDEIASGELTPGRMFALSARGAARLAILEMLWRTSRMRFIGVDRLAALMREQGAVVPVFWHQHLLMCARFIVDRRVRGLKPGFMISPSVDGQAPTMLAQLYGAHVVRGSGSYTGVRAVRGVYQAIVKEVISPASRPMVRAARASSSSRARSSPRRSAARPSCRSLMRRAREVAEDLGQVRDSVAVRASSHRDRRAVFSARETDDEEMAAAQRELERRMLETYRASPKRALKLVSAIALSRLSALHAILIDALFDFDLNRRVRDAESLGEQRLRVLQHDA